MGAADPYDLARFVAAQNPVYDQVLRELRTGRKTSHWIWFIFPQIQGLGLSAMSQRYAIGSRAEAEAYLGHPVLGPRLKECTRLVCAVDGKSAEAILGGIDAAKFRSSMTLFGQAAPGDDLFQDALEKYFSGKPDPLTLQKLK